MRDHLPFKTTPKWSYQKDSILFKFWVSTYNYTELNMSLMQDNIFKHTFFEENVFWYEFYFSLVLVFSEQFVNTSLADSWCHSIAND